MWWVFLLCGRGPVPSHRRWRTPPVLILPSLISDKWTHFCESGKQRSMARFSTFLVHESKSQCHVVTYAPGDLLQLPVSMSGSGAEASMCRWARAGLRVQPSSVTRGVPLFSSSGLEEAMVPLGERLSGRTEGARDDQAVARSAQTALHLFLLFCSCLEGLWCMWLPYPGKCISLVTEKSGIEGTYSLNMSADAGSY